MLSHPARDAMPGSSAFRRPDQACLFLKPAALSVAEDIPGFLAVGPESWEEPKRSVAGGAGGTSS
jgi:hypothetical protein